MSLRQIRTRLVKQFIRRISPHAARVLAWRFMEKADIRSVTFERGGLTWTVASRDYIAADLFIDGGFHAAEMAALARWMRRNEVLQGSRDVLVDVGANIGTTCIPMVREFSARGLAIEPVAANVRLLKQNVESNGLSGRIVLAKSAVLRTPGVVRMCLTTSTGSNFVERQGAENLVFHEIIGHEEVAADTLTAIIANAGFRQDEIALVWADVQGCELDVVESGAPLWALGVPLFAEIEPSSLRQQGTLKAFPGAVAKHFHHFLISNELVSLEERAVPRPITDLPAVIQSIHTPADNVNVLFLPEG